MLKLLIKMYVLELVRSDRSRLWVIQQLMFLVLFVLPALLLAYFLGTHFDTGLEKIFSTQNSLPLINAVIFLLLTSTGIMAPLIKKENPVPVQRYLCLPVSRGRLAFFYHMLSVCNLNNLWLLVFILGVWIRSILPRFSLGEAGLWLFSSLILLLCSHLVANAFRLLLWKSIKLYVLMTAVVLLGSFVSLVLYFDSWGQIANSLYPDGGKGHYTGLAYLIGVSALLMVLLVKSTAKALLLDQRSNPKKYFFLSHQENKQSDSLRLIIFELKLLTRNARTKLFFLNLLIFPVWGASMLLAGMKEGNFFALGVGLLLVINVTGMSYTLIGFRLKSIFYDRLIALPYRTASLVQTVVILSHVITTPTLLLVAVLFMLTAEQFLFPLFAVYLYSLGVVNYVNAYLAIYNTRRYDISSTAFNRRELTNSNPLMPLVGTILVSLPPIGLFVLFAESPKSMLFALLGVIGVAGMAGHERWIRAISDRLRKNKYTLLEGFRTS